MKLNPLAWLRASANGNRRRAAHMTFAKSSVGRSISRTGLFLRKQIWVWPIIAPDVYVVGKRLDIILGP
jgi:hypothetical protein